MSALNLKIAQHFLQEEPAGAARLLSLQTPDVAAELLKTLPNEVALNVLKVMQPRSAAEILITQTDVDIARWLGKMKLADIAAILRHLQDEELARFLNLISVRRQTLCKMLISYPDYTVGAWVETDVLILEETMTVEESLLRLKKRDYIGFALVYVVNQHRHVVGQLSLTHLLRKAPQQKIADLMDTHVASLSGYTELHSALKSPVWAQQDQVAVANRSGDFIGVLPHYRVRSALGRMDETQDKPSESLDLLDAYTSSFASMLDTLVPVKVKGK
ncbi:MULTISPECIES: magnesium transporter MgtE N-terminal domain-containing protein [Pseudoalteromonas]|uniref:magnesium transporter MgtE N-terminal domain-containing protein n=1 Tax=Pseudoalteromonas TaxID=53246 RepID=UPI001C943869|nr:CBS domain-containing protein [Pseudoalteromonas piscicida]QZO14951.1 magnesium transporter [Pseudoalteromonas piscicida]